MSFDDLIRDGVALANELTSDLQMSVALYRWRGDDGLGGVSYAEPLTLTALVESDQRIRRLPDGRELLVDHVLSILQPVADEGTSGRREPIDPRDKFVLPDGATGRIVHVSGLGDPNTNRSYFYQVYLGEG